MHTEKLLDEALDDALANNLTFRAWFLSRTRLGGAFHDHVWSNAKHPWGKVRLLYANATSGAIEVIEREGETDVLAVFRDGANRRLGLHIENKRAGGSFTEYQPELYAARAEAWRGHSKYENYDVWETVLVAPQAFYDRNSTDARKFMTYISHEDIGSHLPAFNL